jgi:hypothetical protein
MQRVLVVLVAKVLADGPRSTFVERCVADHGIVNAPGSAGHTKCSNIVPSFGRGPVCRAAVCISAACLPRKIAFSACPREACQARLCNPRKLGRDTSHFACPMRAILASIDRCHQKRRQRREAHARASGLPPIRRKSGQYLRTSSHENTTSDPRLRIWCSPVCTPVLPRRPLRKSMLRLFFIRRIIF